MKINIQSKRELVIVIWLLFLVFIYATTEILSYYDFFTKTGVCIAYTILFFGITFLVFTKRIELIYKNTLKEDLKNHTQYVFPFVIIGLVLLITAFIAIYTPPNNWDSMTYHLGRIVHWIQNENVEYYPTHLARQLFNPPLTEYVIAHTMIITGSDRFANLIQWIAFANCIILSSLIVKKLVRNKHAEIIASVLAATMPMAILQSTNTKNELTIAMLVMSVVYFMLQYFYLKEKKALYLIAISVGLSFLTKGTSYIYLAPIIIVFGVWFIIQIKTTQLKPLVISFIFVLVLVAPFYSRNYLSYGHPFGASAEERFYYSNNEMNLKYFLSNVSRNLYLHLSNVQLFDNSELFEKNGRFYKNIVEKFHFLIDVNISDPNTTWGGTNLDFTISRDEDHAGNYLITFLMAISFFWLPYYFIKGKENSRMILIYLTLTVLMSMFFCYYLKWQPWHSRLHTTIFMLFCPFLGIFISNQKRMVSNSIILILFLCCFSYLVENQTKILLFKGQRIYNLTRDDIMFTEKGRQPMLDTYQVGEMLKKNKINTIGLILHEDGWDYPFYKILKRYNSDLNIHHVNVQNRSTPQIILDKYPKIKPAIVISTENSENEILIDSVKYYIIDKLNTCSVYKLAQ